MNSRNIASILKILFWGVVALIASLLFLSFYRGENPFVSFDTQPGPLSILHEETISDNITSIHLSWNVGGVTVIASKDDKIHLIERSYNKVSQNKWLSTTIVGETLRITSRNKNAFWFFIWHSPETYLELQLPVKTYDDFRLNVTSGQNEVHDLSTKKFDINSTSGSLWIKNLNTEKLDFSMTSGQTTIEASKTHDLSGVMTSGSLKYEGMVDQSIHLTMTSGQFNTTLTEIAPQSINFQMTSGLAQINLKAPADFTLALSKTSGSFAANFQHTQDGNKYTYKNGKDDYRFGMTSGSLSFSIQE